MTDHDEFLAELAGTADGVHRTTPRASVPPPDLWDQVLTQASPREKEKTTMSTAALASTSSGQMRGLPEPVVRGKGIGHYVHLAVTVSLVFIVAVAGWFATMQLSQPGGPDGRFALFSQTGDSATCDVEPMTVDEVMEIVQNPYRYSLESNEAPEGVLSQAMELADKEYAEAWSFRIDSDLLNSRSQGQYKTEGDFQEAVSRMNEWLGCLQMGTIGHVFRFTDPFEIQRIVLSNHPVIRDMEAIRSGVMELLEMPAAEIVRAMITLPGKAGYTILANENRDDSLLLGEDQSMRYNASLIFQIGIRVIDEDGAIVYENTASGIRTNDATVAQSGPFTVLMAESAYNGEWYVLAVMPMRS